MCIMIESSASGHAPEEEEHGSYREDRETQRALSLQRRRDVQRSQLRLAPPNRIPFVCVIAKCLDSGPDPGGVRGKGSLGNPFSYK